MKSSANQQQPQAKFVKWLVLFAFTETSFVCNILGMMLVPLWGVLPIYYGVSQSQLNWITNWLYICPAVFCRFWNILILKNFGISQILASILAAVGMWMAWFAKTDFFMTSCAYFFVGLALSIKLQVPLYISKTWFEPDERIKTTFIAQYACNSACVCGYIFTSFYFYGLEDWTLITERISSLFYIMAILATISIPISFITLIKPKNQDQGSREKLWSSYKKIYCSSESIFDLGSAGSIFAFCFMYPALIEMQLTKLKQSNMDIFINGVTFQGVAIIIALFCTIRLDKQSKKGLQQNYDAYIKFWIIIGCVSLIFELLFLEILNAKLLNIVNCMVAGLNSIYSLLLESFQEKHYPVEELVIGTVVEEITCFLAFIFCCLIAIESFFIISFQVTCFFLIPGFCYLIVFYETKFNRFEFEA